MTVAIAAISFAGYVAIKLAGDRAGSVITGIAGGLASSTAVTLTLSRLAREHPGQRGHLLAGIVLSGATMMVRVLTVVAIFNAALLSRLAAPVGLAAATLAAIGLVLLLVPALENEHQSGGIRLVNPFEIGTVLRLGLLLTVVTVAAKLLTAAAGAAGAYALAAVSGLADVDALTLSMARLGARSLGADTAARAIVIVVAVNTVTKAVLGWIAGGRDLGQRLAAATAAALAAGGIGVLFGP
jgi:uncharacterized membrane protein (DUF4010 family)